jgi:hypothetical protein
MKMGLWETVSVTTMQLPPAMAEKMAAAGGMAGAMGGAPRTDTIKSCITPESWQKAISRSNSMRGDCTYTDKTITATGMTFAVTCSTRGGGTTKISGKATFDGPEKATSTAHMEMAMPSMPGGGAMTTDVKGTMRYLGPDCGDVKPYTDKAPR